MIRSEDILNAINLELVRAFPARVMYIDDLPQGFVRPSFFLAFLTSDLQDSTMHTVSVTEYYALTVFEPKDRDYNSDTLALIRTQSMVMELFRPGKLAVLDRWVDIRASSAGRDKDEIYIDIEVSFADSRGLPCPEAEMTQQIDTVIRVEEAD